MQSGGGTEPASIMRGRLDVSSAESLKTVLERRRAEDFTRGGLIHEDSNCHWSDSISEYDAWSSQALRTQIWKGSKRG